MFGTFLEYAQSTLVLCAVSFVAGGFLWPKIVDKLTGVPSGFRAAMNNVEAKAKADVQSAVADVFSHLAPAAPVAPVAPPAPHAPVVAPVAPVTPATQAAAIAAQAAPAPHA